uniref:AlNc14C70G4826 protein n=1 Tax=Albugo laibachii Nc14 TaxID=890382 RepID=F0WDV7_9STRA|nr:AlNc14C70G4826 [Albugo laibachii Nc14]|eukprot:CCA19385.1 AlNc14C70G4826 [Albugo laibachii Nc14]
MLLVDSDGVKHPPTLVYKSVPSQIPLVAEENRVQRNGFGVRLWKRMQKIQERMKMHVYGNKTAWWNSNLQLKFLDTFFSSRPDMSVPVLLLLDDFSGHWTQLVCDYVTAINVIMLKPFKDQIRAQWIGFLREQIEEWRVGEPLKMKAPERENVADWIRTAWDHLSIKTISGGYPTTHTAVGDENESACFVVSLARLSLLDTTSCWERLTHTMSLTSTLI